MMLPEVHYGLTSLAPAQIALGDLERLWRGHWTIEHVPHYIRDVTFGEDRSQVRSDHAPQALAALRNALITSLRLEGWPCLPTAMRHFAAHPQRALHFLGALSACYSPKTPAAQLTQNCALCTMQAAESTSR